jgi:hypothetical protein
VNELRDAFTLTELLGERIRTFRESRVTALLVGRELPVRVANGGKLALHIIPLSSFSGPDRNPIAPTSSCISLFPPLGATGWNYRINLDGLVTYHGDKEETRAYAQVFRSGVVETALVLREIEGRQFLPSKWYEKEIVQTTSRYLDSLKKLGISGSIYLFLSLINMRGFRLGVNTFFDGGEVLDRDLVLIPEVTLDLQSEDLPTLIRPAFDMVWNAFGYERSFNYDEAGNWKA